MLGKYYSIFLVAGFVVAALCHPARWDYLKSPAPWIAVGSGIAVLSPHLYWLLTTSVDTFTYAFAVHGRYPWTTVVWHLVPYALGGLSYVAIPAIVYWAVTRPDRRTLAAALWPADPDRRMLVILLAVPLILPMVVSPIIGMRLTPLWTMSAWFLLPIVMLAPADITVPRPNAVRVAIGVLCYSLVVLAASPAVAIVRHLQERESPRYAHSAAVSWELTRAWRQAFQRPLTIVGGDVELALSAAFYSPDHPDAFASSSRITSERLAREGWVMVCSASDQACSNVLASIHKSQPGAVRSEFENSASFLGMKGPPVRFELLLVPARR